MAESINKSEPENKSIRDKAEKAKVALKKGATTAHGVLKTAKSLGVPVPKAALKISGMVANKVRVYGKAQNRTALGIVHAYMEMNPDSTLEDLRGAFPNDLCPDRGAPENFLTVEDAASYNERMSLYFAKPEETLHTGDGQEIAMSQIWSKSSLDRIISAAANYGIEVAKIDKAYETGEAGFSLKYLNGYVPPVRKKKKHHNWWLYFLIIILIAVIIILAIR